MVYGNRWPQSVGSVNWWLSKRFYLLVLLILNTWQQAERWKRKILEWGDPGSVAKPMVPKLCVEMPWATSGDSQGSWGILYIFEENTVLAIETLHELLTWGSSQFQQKRLCYLFLNDTTSFQSWVLGVCYDKRQVICENNLGPVNETGDLQSNSKVWEVLWCPISTHVPLVSNCGYKEWNKMITFFNLSA